MGLVPRAIKEENKMAFGLNMQRLMGVLITMMLSVSVGNTYVHAYLRVPFIIFCVVVFVVLNTGAPDNPKRRMWQGLVIWIIGYFTPRRYLSIIGYAFKKAETEGKDEG